MSDLELILTLPAGFSLESAEPQDKFDGQSRSFHLGKLASGRSGDLKITGLILGSVGSRGRVYLSLKYKANDKTYHALNSLDYEIVGSAFSLAVSAPQEIYQGMETPVSLTLKNGGEKDLNNLFLQFADGWEIKSDGRALEGKSLPIDSLGAGVEKIFGLTVSTARGAGSATLKPALFISAGKEKLKLSEAITTVAIKQPKFYLTLDSLKNSIGHNESTEYNLQYKNSEATALSQVEIKISSGNKNYDLANLSLMNPGGLKIKTGNTVAIENLASGEAGEARLKVKFDRRKIEANQELYLLVDISYKLNGWTISFVAASSRIKIISDLAVRTAAYYYSPQGDQLGVGPLPPAVNMPTSYWIFLQADNSGNKLTNFSLTADLTSSVYWTDRKSLLAGNLYHGEIGGRLIWSIDELPSAGGVNKASFEIQIIPGAGDEGKIMDLLGNIRYTAHDDFTGTDLEGSLPQITTELTGDRLAKGLGRVVK
jgi:hypothetical protein